MKTLKKTLSLVLVFVMVLGVLSVGGYATKVNDIGDYKDIDEIKYIEAVDVLSGIGILSGYDTGDFQPNTVVTREQAAKIITYMLIGATAADALKANADPFDDVKADRWSAGYIAYCVDAGILDGYGDGNFGPADQVTGYQLGKMLLCAIGYGANGEYTGASWSLGVARDAIPLGLYENNVKGASNTPATRDEAALYTFNALTGIYKVSYSTLLGTYTIGGLTLTGTTVGETLGQSVYNLYRTATGTNSYAGYFRYDGGLPITFGTADGFTVKKYNINQVAIDDSPLDMGRNAYVWYVEEGTKNLAVSDHYFDDNVLGTTTNGDKTVDVKNKKSAKYIADLEGEFDIYLNDTWVADETDIHANSANVNPADITSTVPAGTLYISTTDYNLYRTATTGIYNAGGTVTEVTVPGNVYAADLCLNGNGVKVEYVDTDDNGQIDSIYYTAYTTAKVATKTSDSVTFTITTTTDWLNFTESNGKWDDVDVIGFDDLAKGDVVTGVNINGKLYVTVCDTDEGKITQVNSTNKSYIINDTTYKIAKFPYSAASVNTTQLALDNELTVYIDEYGYIVNTGDVTVNLKNIYYVKGNNAGQAIGGATTKVYGTDGVTQNINVEKFYNYTTSALTDVAGTTVPAVNALQYQAFLGSSDNGNWTLNRLAGFVSGQSLTPVVNKAWKVSKESTAIQVSVDTNDPNPSWAREGTVFANDNTVFVDVTNGRVYNGYSSLPKSLVFTSGAYVLSTSASSPNLLTVVFMDGTVTGGDTTKFAVYKADEFISNVNSKNEAEYTWTVVIDGAVTTRTVNKAVHDQIINNGTGLYTVSNTNSSNVITGLNATIYPFPASMTTCTYNEGSVLTNGVKSWITNSSTIYVRMYLDAATGLRAVDVNADQSSIVAEVIEGGVTVVTGSTIYVEAKGASGVDADTAKTVYIWMN